MNQGRAPIVRKGNERGGARGNLIRDIKHGARSLRQDKGFAAAAVLTMAVCIAAFTATFAIVHSVLLRPLPVPNADAIVLMSNLYPKAGVTDQNESAAPDYYDRLRAVAAIGLNHFPRVARCAGKSSFHPEGRVVAIAVNGFSTVGFFHLGHSRRRSMKSRGGHRR